MRIWLHTLDAITGDLLGFLDVRPDSSAQALIAAGKADPVNSGNQMTPAPGAKWAGQQAIVIDTTPPPLAPSVTTNPVIVGGTTVGSILNCTTGVYAGYPVPTVTRQWKADGTNIAGATGLTYVTVAGDVGKAVTCVETATNASGTATGTSNAITVV